MSPVPDRNLSPLHCSQHSRFNSVSSNGSDAKMDFVSRMDSILEGIADRDNGSSVMIKGDVYESEDDVSALSNLQLARPASRNSFLPSRPSCNCADNDRDAHLTLFGELKSSATILMDVGTHEVAPIDEDSVELQRVFDAIISILMHKFKGSVSSCD